MSEQIATDSRDPVAVRVVIAEDSPTQAAWLQHALTKRGCSVTVAHNGEEALEAVRAERPHILVSDVVMPKLDGYGLCRAVKSDPATAGVRVVLATSMNDPADILRGLAAGADDFIAKPYDEEGMRSRLFDGRHSEPSPSGAVRLTYRGEEHEIASDPTHSVNFMLSALEEAEKRRVMLEEARDSIASLEAEARSQSDRLRSIIEALPLSVGVVDTRGEVLYLSAATKTLWGADPMPRGVSEYHEYKAWWPDTGEQLRGEDWTVARVLKSGQAILGDEFEIERFDGAHRHIRSSAAPFLDNAGEIVGIVGVTEDITENFLLREELKSLSLTDDTTGLYNRRGFRLLADEQVLLERRRGSDGAGLSILFADIDDMKSINDTYGHDAGDAALVRVAEVLRLTCREADVLARMGGDEFAVLLVDCAQGSLEEMVVRLDAAFEARNEAEDVPWRLQLSVGSVTAQPSTDLDVDELLRIADARMYEVKRARHGYSERMETS